jgi:ABC-type transport system involved in multi-copper enzyme maturation permease subunit
VKARTQGPYRHDLLRSWTIRAVFAVVVLCLAAGASAVVAVVSAGGSFSVSGSALYYYEEGAYHISIWAYDAGGAPVSGVQAQITVTSGESNRSPAGPYELTSDSQGEIALSIPTPDQASANLTVESLRLVSARSVTVLWGGFFYSSPPALPTLYLGYLAPGVVKGITLAVSGAGFFSASSQALVFAAGPNGTLPWGLSLETCWTPQIYSPFGGRSGCSGLPTELLGSVTGFWSHFPLGEYPGNASTVFLQLVNRSGQILDLVELPGSVGTAGASFVVNHAPGVPILTDFAAEESFFLPMAAIVVAYWIYARPRLSGAVEPVLARPVTRRGIFLTRYASVAGVLTVASVAELSVLDAACAGILGEPVPTAYLAPILGSLLVASLGSAGLVFLLAHLVKTSASTLTFSLVPLAAGFFWSSLLLGLLLLSNPAYGPGLATSLLLPTQLLFLPQFPSLTSSLLTGLSPYGTPLGPSPGGVGLAVEAGFGVAWVLVPLFVAYRLAATRD